MFHLYLFHDKLNGPATRVFVYRNPGLSPDSYSPGFVKHQPIQAANIKQAKQLARNYAPRVFTSDGREVR